MNPASLHADELEYELTIRGVEFRDNEKVSMLIELLNQHAQNEVTEEQLGALDPRTEYEKLKWKLKEIETLIAEASACGLIVDKPIRPVSLFVHTVIRLRRIMYRSMGSGADVFIQMAKKLNHLHDLISQLAPALIFPCLHVPSEDEDPWRELEKLKIKQEKDERKQDQSSSDTEAQTQTSSKKSKQATERPDKSKKKSKSSRRSRESRKKKKKRSKKASTSESSSSSSPSSSSSSSSDSDSPDRAPRSGKFNPLSRWKWRFSGKEDLFTFLDKVEESADVHGVKDSVLLAGISLLLEGDAHVWFRAKKNTITSWRIFKKEIKEAFDPGEDDEHILEKLSQLKQSSSETYVVFEARCEELFARLQRPLDSQEKLKKVLKGLHLYYRSRVSVARIESLRKLRKRCQEIEKDKAQIMKLEEEKKKKDRKDYEKEDRRFKPVHAKVAAAEASGSSSEEVEVAAAAAPKNNAIVCWRCGRTGHFSSHCSTKIFCVGCGQPDTLAEHCPRCARASAAGHWNQQKTAPQQPENPRKGQQRGILGPFHTPPPSTPQAAQHPLPVLKQDQRGPERN